MGLIARGAFDIGSAATKLQVARVDVASGRIREVLFGEERQCFFALDLSRSSDGCLSDAIQAEGLKVLRGLMDVLRAHGAEGNVAAVATEVFRRAKNGGAYLARVERELGLRVQMITQGEEALLGYKTAAGLCAPSVDRATLIAWDTGGASFQISTMRGGNGFKEYRGRLGSSVATAMCLQKVKPPGALTTNPLTYGEATQLRLLLERELDAPPGWLGGHVESVGGPNSTFCLAAQILGKGNVTVADVWRCIEMTVGKTDAEVAAVCKLSAKHDPPQMAVPKLVLLHTVMCACGISDFTFIPSIGSCAGMLVSDVMYAKL